MKKQTLLIDQTGRCHDLMIESLRNKKKASAYLQLALDEYQEEGDIEFFLMALRNVAEAQGGMGKLAKKTRLNRQHLYNALSSDGNPRLDTLSTLIQGLGFHLSIEPLRHNP